ncbi:MAG: pyridinium-3,5-bisthiocarboxylic acid mononucleotide nickel chelatase [Chloroflexota bacterium]|nr:pyridinium-3,5-bisthiocarboxylic acid mononucleotide nickel chelatase [Chloroflexota bacterium]
MSRVAYFDCFSGASGDMILGALIDAGLALDDLRSELGKLALTGYTIAAERVMPGGLGGTQVRVALTEPQRHGRHLAEIERIIESSTLSDAVKLRALSVFRRLGAVEARIHGTSIDEVHFHEVGAVDAIVDIVGAAVGLEKLGIQALYASSLPLGHGAVNSMHGILPLPAPATLALIAEAGAPTRPVDVEAELVTPTGAAILTTTAKFEQPAMRIDAIGVGYGQKVLPWPNVTRVWLGESTAGTLESGEVTVIETNLDDSTPEQIGYAIERLFAAGALDVFTTPVYMKKNRPGVLLTVLAQPARADELAHLILRETSSLGVRFRTSQRLMCTRRSEMVDTSYGPLEVKIKSIDGADVVCPEYEACARVARERNVPLARVYEAVATAGARYALADALDGRAADRTDP